MPTPRRREHDSNRKPLLDPISHVKIRPQNERNVFTEGDEVEYDDVSGRVKYDAAGNIDSWRSQDARAKEARVGSANYHLRKDGKTPVQKINSNE